MDKDLYDLPPEELADVPTVCASLRQALEEPSADRGFPTAGVSSSMITDLHRFEDGRGGDLRTSPASVEFKMYYSV